MCGLLTIIIKLKKIAFRLLLYDEKSSIMTKIIIAIKTYKCALLFYAFQSSNFNINFYTFDLTFEYFIIRSFYVWK